MAGKVRKISIDLQGKIPWVHVDGPIKDMLVSENLYILLKNDPRVRSKMTESPVETVKPVEEKKETVTTSVNTEISIHAPEVKQEDKLEEKAEAIAKILEDKINAPKEDIKIKAETKIEEDEDEPAISPEGANDPDNLPPVKTEIESSEVVAKTVSETIQSPVVTEDEVDKDMDAILETLTENIVDSKEDEEVFGDPVAVVAATNEAEKLVASASEEKPESIDVDLTKALYTETELQGYTKAQLKEICANKGIKTLYHDRIPGLITKILAAN